jgi:hypothetical protein
MSKDPRAQLMSEADLQAAIVELAQQAGWTVDFVPDWFWRLAFASMKRQRRGSRQWSPPGKPDLLLVKPGRLVFAELKSEKGTIRKPQREWLELLQTVPGVEVHIWRPRHWLSGEIDKVLV